VPPVSQPDSSPRTERGPTRPVVALAGGVGAARLLRGLVQVVDPAQISVIVNTGDDREFYGVQVAPDLDIVTYTLAGVVDNAKGFGLSGDHYTLMDRLGALGHETWFRLGDRDFAHCLHRSLRLREGAGLAQVTDELRRAHGLDTLLLPMSEAPCPTLVELDDGRSLHFEEYLVREKSPAHVPRVDLSAARAAAPGPGVLSAIANAETIVICPSNPVVSIGPILSLEGVRETLRESHARVVAISPIIGGAPVKGPADHLLRAIGCEVSARGVADLYRDIADAFLLDRVDSEQIPEIEAMGMRAGSRDTLMVDRKASAAVAQAALDLIGSSLGDPR
jgi:LPPG:FO 2-phospho-L-lactate transferase